MGNAQNINFGMKGGTVRSFLEAYGIEPVLSATEASVGRAEVVRGMRDAIFRIVCLE